MAGSTGTAGSDGCTSFEGERMASFDQRVCSIPNVQWRASQTLNFAHVSSAPLRALVDFEWLNTEHKRTRPTLSAPPAPPIWISNGKKALPCVFSAKLWTLEASKRSEQFTLQAVFAVLLWTVDRAYAFAHARTGVLEPVLCLFRAPGWRYQYHSFIIHLSFICSRLTKLQGKARVLLVLLRCWSGGDLIVNIAKTSSPY